MDNPPGNKRLLASIGLIIGILALAAAFMSPWIARHIDPPARPLEEVAVDLALRVADAAKAKIKSQQYAAPATAAPKPSRFIVPIVVGAGMLAAMFGVLGGLRSEDRFFSAGAVALGTGAAVVQWSIVIASALVLILLVGALIAAFQGAG